LKRNAIYRLMVTKCANPACPAIFRYLKEGRLSRLKVEYDKDEYFWLCSDCASKMVLKVENGRVITVPIQTSKLPETALASAASSYDPNPQRTKDVFVAVDCANDHCRGRIFLMRAGERYSSHRPELPSLFKIVCPYCGNRQTMRRAATYYIEADSITVTLTDIL
jgi:hypothetical protein